MHAVLDIEQDETFILVQELNLWKITAVVARPFIELPLDCPLQQVVRPLGVVPDVPINLKLGF